MRKMKVAWRVPEPAKGAGGFRTIVQNASMMHDNGYICDFYFEPSGTRRELLSERIVRWFNGRIDDVFTNDVLIGEYDIVIATAWNTVEWVLAQEAKHKVYFIQDYEPLFLPMSYQRIKAERSYVSGLIPITIGRWLYQKMKKISTDNCFCCDFGADKDVYNDLGLAREHAVCAIYQPEKPRRMTPLLEDVIRILLECDSELVIYVYGSEQEIPFSSSRVIDLGIVSVDECNALYNKCKCGLSFSGSNPSRIPFEMMAAGLPVVDIYLENNLFDIPDYAALLSDPEPAAMASAVLKLVRNDGMRISMSTGGRRFMADRSVESEAFAFLGAIESVSAGTKILMSDYEAIYRSAKAFCSDIETENALIQVKRYAKKQAEDSLRPISGNVFSIDVKLGGSTGCRSNDLRLAVWAEANQEDLEWVSSLPNGTSVRFVVELNEDQRSVMNRLFHFHLYDFGNQSNPKPVLTFDRMIHVSSGVFDPKRRDTIKIGSSTVEITACNGE